MRIRMSRLPCSSIRDLCELTLEKAIISLIPSTPFSNPDFKHSMHKTFTDCYLAQGFTGGGWSYSMNTNDADGLQVDSSEPRQEVLEEENRRLAYYYLGWESVEVGIPSPLSLTTMKEL